MLIHFFNMLLFPLTEVSATRSSPYRKKTVSFSSTTSGSYKTAREYDSDNRATDTDYFSPDEDDDEFFDLSPEDGYVFTKVFWVLLFFILFFMLKHSG